MTTRRIDRGRGHSYLLDGKPVIGVTTAISGGVPKPAIAGWVGREVASFAMDNLELIGMLDREAGVDLLKGVPWRERDKAARRGTEVHSLAERIGAGEEVEVPKDLAGHVDSYLDFLERFDPEIILAEVTVINRRWWYMGTLDLICRIPGFGLCLLDIKTTRSGVFPEASLQLAAYRHAETYLAEGGENPMPIVDWTGVVWVRADGYDLVPVEAGEGELRTFLYALQLASWMDVRSKLVVGPAVEPPPRPTLEVVR